MPPPARLTLGEGGTPAVEAPGLAAELGLARLVLKREDQNPTGSHKDRGLAYQVSLLGAASGPPAPLVVSSSGNAALAAAAYAAAAGLPLVACLAPGTPAGKLAALDRLGALVLVSPRALAVAEALSAAGFAPNLRPSTHPHAVEGFQSIGWELAEEVAPVEALFTFVSSASSFVGIGRAFARAGDVTARPWQPGLHAVQGTGACPVAAEFDARPPPPGLSRLGARGARKTRRIGEAKRLVGRTGGGGWIVTDEEADAAAARLAAHGILASPEGAASLAAAGRAAREGGVRTAIVVLTGRPDWPPDPAHGPIARGCPAEGPRIRAVDGPAEAIEVADGYLVAREADGAGRAGRP